MKFPRTEASNSHSTATRRALGAAFIVLLATTPAALPASARSGAVGHLRPTQMNRIPDITVLFGHAVSIVHRSKKPQFTNAVVLEADGTPRAHTAKYASGIVSWRFVFDNQSSKSKYASATISYGPPPKRFSKFVAFTQPFLEDVVIRKAPKMTLLRAVHLLRAAGHYRSFATVTLRNPLGPKQSNPLYIFGFTNGNYVAVDTVTGKVRPIS